MQPQNATYSQWWTLFAQMTPERRAKMWAQHVAKIQGVTLQGVIEALEDAPEPAKIEVWKRWAECHDLSGYVLKQIEALKETEPASAVDGLMKRWITQADMKAYRLEDVVKMAERLPTLEDAVSLWGQWASQADLRKYEIEAFVKILTRLSPKVSVILAQEWVKQNGSEVIWKIGAEKRNRLVRLGLSPDAARPFNEVYSQRTSPIL